MAKYLLLKKKNNPNVRGLMHKLGIDHTLCDTCSQMGALSTQGLKRKPKVDEKEKLVAEI